MPSPTGLAGQSKEAIVHYDHAIRLNPNSAVYHANRAAANAQLGNYAEAIKDWCGRRALPLWLRVCARSKASVAIDPSYAKAWLRLAKGAPWSLFCM